MCAMVGRASEVELSSLFGVHRIVSEFQTSGAELFTLLNFGLLCSDCDYALALPFWSKEVLNLGFFFEHFFLFLF